MAARHANPGSDRPPGSSTGGGWRAFLDLTVPGFCWEFLRRNPSYRAHFDSVVRGDGVLDPRWGLSALADPDLPADAAKVLWRAEVAPGLVVPMEPASFSPSRAVPRAGLTPITGLDGRHIRLPSGLQLQLLGEARAAGPLIVVLAYDADFNLRVRAVHALRRASLTDTPPRSRLSLAQRQRLARCLYALDANLRSRSYRDIADELFGAWDEDPAAFRTSNIRDVTIRLVRRGRALMSGGYLKLIRGGF